jgi:hypothetical protein
MAALMSFRRVRLVLWTALSIAMCVMALRPPAAAANGQSAPRAPGADVAYWCPMHPDQRSTLPGVCPVCGMRMVRMPPARFATYPVDLRATPTLNGVRLRLAVRDPVTRLLVRRFVVVHERPLHLFVVGDGLSFFAHEHPSPQPDGVFMIDLALPRAGPYMAIAEFLPEGGTAQMFQQAFTTGAPFDRAPPPAIDVAPRTVDGLQMTIDASKLHSGGVSALSARIQDAASGADATDLEPYLGASAHLLMVAADLTEAIHGHPEEDRRPALAFAPLVPAPGRYKLWLQVQRHGHVTTFPFVVDVP